tara:strand:+ start:1365 stop:1535 length:171 start_codon:yes stop_codon:yes gene_type:complete
MSYKVTSSKVAGHEIESIVTEDDLEGINVPALIAGGHLTATKPNSRKPANLESEAD